MTNRVSFSPEDFHNLGKQAERDRESKRLAILMTRVKQQIADRSSVDAQPESPKPPAAANAESSLLQISSRTLPFQR
ncbi:MAG TPA: hypothetical protein VMD76_04610 [Candidatus Sulfotelmatobacter sp.]|jgi:hypothetical protein|nr:hypothetical protein [Candidatus Sulfotelmatobacter sp.]